MAEYISFQPSDFFSTKLYTGTGAELANTGVGFQPDLIWNKERSGTEGQNWTDAVRGATKYVMSNNNDGQSTNAESVKSFDSDGFTLGTFDGMNTDTETYVAWNWKAGTTTGLTGGTITPTSYSINTTSGVGIYQYTGNEVSGATIAHGLGVIPQMIIVKRTQTTGDWMVYHEFNGNGKYLSLNGSAAAATSTSAWNDTSPTSTLFYLGDGSYVNADSSTYIAYAFAPINGYSKFGTYSGNGNADGPMLYTGFRPSMVIVKNAGADEAWRQWDDKREGYNPTNDSLSPNNSWTEAFGGTAQGVNLLSNGFKITSSNSEVNTSGTQYIYAAWAQFPTVSSNDVPTVAR